MKPSTLPLSLALKRLVSTVELSLRGTFLSTTLQLHLLVPWEQKGTITNLRPGIEPAQESRLLSLQNGRFYEVPLDSKL